MTTFTRKSCIESLENYKKETKYVNTIIGKMSCVLVYFLDEYFMSDTCTKTFYLMQLHTRFLEEILEIDLGTLTEDHFDHRVTDLIKLKKRSNEILKMRV